MTIEDRKARERVARRRLITTTARRLAEREGWDAVTTRRLSTEIEYSQPVLYQHFASMQEIVDAVALDGFAELAGTLRDARLDEASAGSTLSRLARAYTTFAADNPVLYEAMFTRGTHLRFGGTTETPAPLLAAFAELRDAVDSVAGHQDGATLTEVWWAALHGLITLGASDRLRASAAAERVQLLVARFE